MDTNLFIDLQTAWNVASSQIRHAYFFTAREAVTCTVSSLPMELNEARWSQEERGENFHFNYERFRQTALNDFKTKMKKNLMNSNRSRWSQIHLSRIKSVRALLKEFAKAARNEDTEEVCNVLNELSHQHSEAWANYLATTYYSDLFKCGDCGDFFETEEEHETLNDDYVCNSCVQNYYWSEAQSVYVHCDDMVRVYHRTRSWNNDDADDYVSLRYAERNYYEYDGSWFTDEDVRDEVRGDNYVDDEDEDDDSYEPRPAGLRDYHCTSRDFVEDQRGKYPALGVELEVYAPNRYEAVNSLTAQFEVPKQLILEKDGSLNYEHGFEIISQPMGRTGWEELAKPLLDNLHRQHVIGFNEPAGDRYGIHVTIHRRHLSALAEARIALFLADDDNKNFVRAVAQRAQIYAWENGYDIGQFTKPGVNRISGGFESQGSWVNGDYVSKTKITGKGRYCPVNFNGHLMEFRIFQSTTNYSSFMKNLEFVWALHSWTKTESATGTSFKHTDFLRWLNTPQHRAEFPYLIAFLSKKTFFGTNYAPIISSWRNLMIKPVETDAIEPMAA